MKIQLLLLPFLLVLFKRRLLPLAGAKAHLKTLTTLISSGRCPKSMAVTTKGWAGTNVTASGDITDTATTGTNANEPWQMEIVDRPAGLIETIDITEDITTTINETTLSIFSQ